MKKLEQVEVKYCDICGRGESDTVTVSSCWNCGRDVCSQHHHLVYVEGGVEKRLTYCCDICRDELEEKLNNLFKEYSGNRP